MYHYEQILNEHRQRVERGVRNYERRRVAAERASEPTASEGNSREAGVVDGGASNDGDVPTSESHLRVGTFSSMS